MEAKDFRKKVRKKLTGLALSAKFWTVRIEKAQQHTHYGHNTNTTMKKALLISAAALAAGVISSQAQVYSQNIVGYVNTTIPGGNAFSMLVAPLAGPTNTAETVISSVSVGDNIFVWNGGGFTAYTYAGTDGAAPGYNWYDVNLNPASSPVLNPGQAFFFQNAGAAKTNVFTGTVVVSNSVTLLGGNSFSMIGSTPPISGTLDSTNLSLPLHVGDNVFLWTGGGYAAYTYAGVDGAAPGYNWYDANLNPIASPTISVGQGFFYQNSATTSTWTNTITIQ